MVVLIDTNVVLDFLTKRQPYFSDAQKIIELCSTEKVEGYIAFHSISNIFFILRKVYNIQERRELLKKICKILTVTGAGHERVLGAIERDDFVDFEDCLQDECALEIAADYIVTRNVSDYSKAKVNTVMPEEFLEILEN